MCTNWSVLRFILFSLSLKWHFSHSIEFPILCVYYKLNYNINVSKIGFLSPQFHFIYSFVCFFLFIFYGWFWRLAGNSKLIHLLHNSEHPTSVFSILDTGTKHIPLVADSLFDLLILKMQPAYTSKKQTKVCKFGSHIPNTHLLK